MEEVPQYQQNVPLENIAPIPLCAMQILFEIPPKDPIIASIVLHSNIHPVLPYF